MTWLNSYLLAHLASLISHLLHSLDKDLNFIHANMICIFTFYNSLHFQYITRG